MTRNGNVQSLLRGVAVTRSAWLIGAGAVVIVIGFAKPIEPLIELGLAIIVVGLLTRPQAKP
jgi:predicted phage tail protein